MALSASIDCGMYHILFYDRKEIDTSARSRQHALSHNKIARLVFSARNKCRVSVRRDKAISLVYNLL